MKILLPMSMPLDIAPPEGAEVVYYSPSAPVPAEHEDAEVLVVWGNSNELLRDAAARLRSLRWVQTLAAGSEAALSAGFTPDAIITSGRSLHDLPVAEHALALVLAAARRLHSLVRAQIGHRWASEIGGIQREPNADAFTTLRGSRMLVWGFGSIARSVTPHLVALGATVKGVARSAREESGVSVISVDDLDAELPNTDVLLMILPESASTHHALDAHRLALLPRHAWVVNVGRGSTVDEDALLHALRDQQIGGAAIDVTGTEPLPPASPLWDQANLIITPHAAGGRPIGAVELIEENLEALRTGKPMRNVVSR